jgi:uncharacterized membrane protein YoaK (UPF0700 family)
VVAAVIAVIVVVTVRPIWPPKVIQATSFVMFTGLAIAGFVAGHANDRWLSRWAGAGAAVVMGLVILILLPVVRFTEQFVRDVTPREQWGSPTFVRINRVLSAAWGIAIVALGASRVVAAIIDRHSPHSRLLVVVFSAVIPVVIVIYMLQFSKTYPDRVTHKTG